jgi:hypothetical protein
MISRPPLAVISGDLSARPSSGAAGELDSLTRSWSTTRASCVSSLLFGFTDTVPLLAANRMRHPIKMDGEAKRWPAQSQIQR